MANNNPAHIVTGRARLSYTHLFEPYANNPGQEAKYSATILVPKTDAAAKQRIDAAINAAIQAGISKRWDGKRPPVLSICVHDGDGPRPSDGEPFGEECKGCWVFTASSKQPPQVVDMGLNPIINQSEMYSGVWARVGVTFFAYNSNGKKGIGCGLETVQKLEDGEPLGGRASAADDFADVSYTAPAPAPAAYQQPVYAQPQAYPAQPVYPQQGYQQPTAQRIDPITGLPF
ncbi:MAG: DUF2815 family protein [Candidatus Fimivivens sp.]|nr:DUF2815 family protein [Candidatus Fimivivens sp.]